MAASDALYRERLLNVEAQLAPEATGDGREGEGHWLTAVLGELSTTSSLALPLVVNAAMAMVTSLTDSIFLGHLGPDELAAAGLVNVWLTVWRAFTWGLGGGVAVLAAQSSKNVQLASLWLLRGLAVSSLAAVFMAIAYWHSHAFLNLAGATPGAASLGQLYARCMLVGLPAELLAACFNGWLTAKRVTSPQLIGATVAVGGNIAFNYLLIYGCDSVGIQGLGFKGSPLATSFTSWLGLLASILCCALRPDGLLKQAMAGWELSQAIVWRGLKPYLCISLPEVMGTVLESLSFDILMLLAANLSEDSTKQVAAMSIIVQIYGVPFMVFLGISEACSVRVGEAVGFSDTAGAKRVAKVGTGIMFVPAIVFGALLVITPRVLAQLFTSDSGVTDIAARSLPICGCALLFDAALCAATMGVLTGLGDTCTTMLCRLQMLVISAPGAWYLGWHRGQGIPGVWWAWLACLVVVGLYAQYRVIACDWQSACKMATERQED